jgi:site-specific DNA-methyltransferase (adenine-specific)
MRNINFINQIILDDCLNILSKIESNSIDLILTDPPYLISSISHFTESNKLSKYNKLSIDFGEWDKNNFDIDLLFSEYKRILKKGGVLIFFYDIWKSNIIKEVGEKYKFTQPRIGQWVKNNPTPINSNANYLSNVVEYFFTFTKGRNATFNSSYDKGIYNFPKCGKGKTEHPTEKPLNLFKALIEKHSNQGDIVLDTFGGSGTTAVAAIETNRNYILIEKEENYVEISNQRIKLLNNSVVYKEKI